MRRNRKVDKVNFYDIALLNFSIFEIFSFLLSFLFELTHSLTAVCIYCGLSEMLHLGSPHRVKFRGQKLNHAPVAELADAYGSGNVTLV